MTTINTVPYTLVHVNEYGNVTAGTNLEFTEGNIRGYINSNTVTLNLFPNYLTSGTFGSSTLIPRITVNEQGLITEISNTVFSNQSTIGLAGNVGSGSVGFNSTLTFLGGQGISTEVNGNTITVGISSVTTLGNIITDDITSNSIAAEGNFIGNLIGNVTGNVTGNIFGNQSGGYCSGTNATFSSTVSVSGLVSVGAISEIMTYRSAGGGIQEHDTRTSSIWYYNTLTTNITANFTNVPTTNNRLYSFAIAVQQGASTFYPDVVQINGSPVTIKWQDGVLPIPLANKLEISGFTVWRLANTWYVSGSYSSFG